jgi:hypothetical protein
MIVIWRFRENALGRFPCFRRCYLHFVACEVIRAAKLLVSALCNVPPGGGDVLPLESVSPRLLLEFHDLRKAFECGKRGLRVADNVVRAHRLQIAGNVLSNAAFYKDSSPEFAHMCRVKVNFLRVISMNPLERR